MSNSKWCKSATGAGHTCRRKAKEDGHCWQHGKEREGFRPWQCDICNEVLANLPFMAGKPVTEAQESYINGLLLNRVVTPEEAAGARMWLAAATNTKSGRDIACILIHQLLHKEKVTIYRQSYLS